MGEAGGGGSRDGELGESSGRAFGAQGSVVGRDLERLGLWTSSGVSLKERGTRGGGLGLVRLGFLSAVGDRSGPSALWRLLGPRMMEADFGSDGFLLRDETLDGLLSVSRVLDRSSLLSL